MVWASFMHTSVDICDMHRLYSTADHKFWVRNKLPRFGHESVSSFTKVKVTEDVGVRRESICCCIYAFTSLKPTYLWCKSYSRAQLLKHYPVQAKPLCYWHHWVDYLHDLAFVFSPIFNRFTVSEGTVLTVCDLFTALIVAMGAFLKSVPSVFPPFDDFFCSLSSFAPLNVLTLGLLCMACLRYGTSSLPDFLGDPDPDPLDRNELLWSALQSHDGIWGTLKSYDCRDGSVFVSGLERLANTRLH